MASRWLRWVWLMAGIWSASGLAHAQTDAAADPYSVSVPVAAQSAPDLQQAAALGLHTVVEHITGRGDADSNPAMSAAFAGADHYLEQYRYERNAADTTGATPWLAQMRFSAAAVNQLLRNAGLSGSAESMVLRVTGVENFDDYAGLLNYLAQLAVIRVANPIRVASDEVTLQLKIQGTTEQLVRQFAGDNRLTPILPANAAAAPALQYRWAPPRG